MKDVILRKNHTLRFDPELFGTFRKLCKLSGTTVTAQIEKLIIKHMASYEENNDFAKVKKLMAILKDFK